MSSHLPSFINDQLTSSELHRLVWTNIERGSLNNTLFNCWRDFKIRGGGISQHSKDQFAMNRGLFGTAYNWQHPIDRGTKIIHWWCIQTRVSPSELLMARWKDSSKILRWWSRNLHWEESVVINSIHSTSGIFKGGSHWTKNLSTLSPFNSQKDDVAHLWLSNP